MSSTRSRYVDINGVAEYLGVTVRHVRRLVAEERIPYLKWGLNLHFDLDEIDAWIDQHRRPARRSSARTKSARGTSSRLPILPGQRH